MKKAKSSRRDELRRSYKRSDFPGGFVRGKYAGRFAAGSNLVRLEPEITHARPAYDFSKGALGKYVARLVKGANVVVLDSDVAAIFRDSKSVNTALRKLAGLSRPRKRRAR